MQRIVVIVAVLAALAFALYACSRAYTDEVQPQRIAQSTEPKSTKSTSTLGGVPVPNGLHCTEDSVIGWLAPDTLGCVHAEGSQLEGGAYGADNASAEDACQRARRTFTFEQWDTRTDKLRAAELVSNVCYP